MKKRAFAACMAAVFIACGVLPVFSAEVDENGRYSDAENTAEKERTEKMYESRPFMLRQAEDLGRGLVAVPLKSGGNLVTWRFLGTDEPGIKWDIYRNGDLIKKDTDLTNYLDKNGKSGDIYSLISSTYTEEGYEESAAAWGAEYMAVPVEKYAHCDYDINDSSVGDIDGDGEYELIVKRIPKDYFNRVYLDNGEIKDERTGYPLIEAYETDGTRLWSIDIGRNEVNDIDINFLVYDIDGDGKAEVTMRTVDGTVDGEGNVIGDGEANYLGSLQQFKDRHYLSEGNEFLSVFDGQTGGEEASLELYPSREPLLSWSGSFKDTGRLTKRASHYLISAAYLDGEKPSVVFMRGAWDAVKLAAYDYDGAKLSKRWEYDSGVLNSLDDIYGAGYHSMTVADVDFDGRDEILSGAAAVDDDGTFLYATNANGVKLGHGDAFDAAKMDPDYNGYYIWSCHETPNLPANIDLHDARTGQVIYGYTKTKDTGRSRAADIDPTSPGWEMWGSTATPLHSLRGEVLVEAWNKFPYRNPDGTDLTDENGKAVKSSLPMNFTLQWDGDLLSEFLDGVTVSEYNWEDKAIDIIMDNDNCVSNGGTKAVPLLCADILGDWREEILWSDLGSENILIYSANIETKYRIPTLMHDITYRQGIAWQNNHYNQPSNTSFYFGNETKKAPVPEIKTAGGTVNPVYENENIHKTIPIDMTSQYVINYVNTEGGVYVSVTDNIGSESALAVAGYDADGVLRSFNSQKVLLKKGETKELYLGELNESVRDIKVFLWNDLNNMTPLCEAYLKQGV